jgi:hypothetical protein
MKAVKAQFVGSPKHKKDACRNAKGQTACVDE